MHLTSLGSGVVHDLLSRRLYSGDRGRAPESCLFPSLPSVLGRRCGAVM